MLVSVSVTVLMLVSVSETVLMLISVSVTVLMLVSVSVTVLMLVSVSVNTIVDVAAFSPGTPSMAGLLSLVAQHYRAEPTMRVFPAHVGPPA